MRVRGCAARLGPGLTCPAYAAPQVRVEVVTEADHRGEADKLAAAYQASALRAENERRLEGYMGSSVVVRGGSGKDRGQDAPSPASSTVSDEVRREGLRVPACAPACLRVARKAHEDSAAC